MRDRQATLFNLGAKPLDVVYTPESVVIDIVDWLHPVGICLDPCRGDGAFFDRLPEGRLWCEIVEDKDFFDFHIQVDWVIGNPPYSIFEEFLRHSFEIADDVAFLVPTNKIFQRRKIMAMIESWGGVRGMRIYGSGTKIGFPFGFSVGVFHFVRGYRGRADVVFADPEQLHNRCTVSQR